MLADATHADEDVLLLTGGPGEMAELVRLGAPIGSVNVGGLHFSAGRRELLPFVYLDEHDVTSLERLLDMGVVLSAQQVPGGKAHPLVEEDLTPMKDGS